MAGVAIVGSGPNGLAAAVTLARAGVRVRVFEAEPTIGGGARTLPLTEPGFLHDWGSAVHPMALASPFFRDFGLADRVGFAIPDASYAQAMPGRSAIAWRSLERTADDLGRDGRAWRRLFAPLVRRRDRLVESVLRSMLPPRHPLITARFGARVLLHATRAGARTFKEASAPALIAGAAAHASGPMPSFGSAATGLMLATLAHGDGWPIPLGGSQSIVDALVAELESLGGVVETDARVTSIAELGDVDAVVLDVALARLPGLVGDRLPDSASRLLRRYVGGGGRPGNGLSKVDFALSAPVPWSDQRLAEAGTVHLGGTAQEVWAAEREVTAGRPARHPYVLLSQPSLFDPSRAPAGRHTVWAYIHVPHGSTLDATEHVTARIEEFAPGFRDTVLASRATTAAELEAHDANLIGGDIGSGFLTLRSMLARPVLARRPWRTPVPGVYLCSASTVPGPGVHGMAGHLAAKTVLRDVFGHPRFTGSGDRVGGANYD
ncbi:phytoene desaturase family protein [Agromyces albus]|uniref:Pyridine nucleotide-disulfide oxidoreductase domain-containing protein 2 n=1 Tax=Agromyces albus TaxID=205332 RepID=A0A4Q2L3X6_9MICO|nr:NAD(P)/FAD-dependent oxidoreductase [Agromyces albus]RXZ72269.1 NAD(P)/FAD-dependent oxidoreductase [Agromyces albus]